MKINFKLIALLFVFWLLLTLNFELNNLLIGLLSSISVSFFTLNVFKDNKSLKIPSLYSFCLYFFKLIFEIYKSSFSHILRIIKGNCNPTIVNVQLDLRDPFLIMLISNSITLTPGTITIDVNENMLTVLSVEDDKENKKTISMDIKDKFEKHFI